MHLGLQLYSLMMWNVKKYDHCQSMDDICELKTDSMTGPLYPALQTLCLFLLFFRYYQTKNFCSVHLVRQKCLLGLF